MTRRFTHRRTLATRDERGVVMVLVAVTLPVLFLFVAFGVEVGHWFDYSRNLQNRADAAALAAAVQYGNTCSGTATAAQTDAIGKVAVQYAGPPTGTPPGNLPPVGTPSSYKNQPNLTAGLPANFHMLLNSTQNWSSGGPNQNWSMGTAGHTTDSTALCSSQDEDGNVGAMVDVRLTQANIPLFFPLFGFKPTISAHARAALEGESGANSAPIAVGDSGFTPCVSVRVVNASNNSVIQTVTLSKEPTDPQNPNAPAQWDNSGSPASFQMPSSDNVYIQPFLSDCNGNGQTYDDGTNTGVVMINNYPSTPPTIASGSPPQLTTNGVIVFGSCPSATPYFAPSGADCTVEVDALVASAPDVGTSDLNLTLVQHQWVNGAWVLTQNPMHPSGNGSNACRNTAAYCTTVTIGDSTGIDQFSLNWSETAGFIGTTQCGTGNGNKPPPCTGQIKNGTILHQVFGACNGCDQPDDSGPIIFARVSDANNLGVITNVDANNLAGGSTHNLVFTLKLSGLNTAAAGDPPIVLRFATSTNHQTGLIDCGQGTGTNADSYVVYYGCGPGNPQFNPPLNPLFINTRNTCGTPPGPPWPNTNQQDCVQTTPGQRRVGIICPLVLRITNQPVINNCTGGAAGTCPTNNWPTRPGQPINIQPGDPRAITMIITSDVDLATGAGSPQAWIPIRKFATFYITGWDSNIKPQCADNESFPTKGHKNSQNGAVWGHWINYEDTAGTPSGQLCVVTPGSPTNCVPALTR